MQKKYISVDVESSGPTPGKYSMLSLGACIVGETHIQFYRELKPLNYNSIKDAMRIGCLGLKCLDDLKHIEEFDPESRRFKPVKVLEILYERGSIPSRVMGDYADWVIKNTRGFKPVEAAAPIKFDGMFTAWYFDNFFQGKNPLGYSGEDMNSFYRGLTGDFNAHMRDLEIEDKRKTQHNALEDAIHQAKEFKKVLEMDLSRKLFKFL